MVDAEAVGASCVSTGAAITASVEAGAFPYLKIIVCGHSLVFGDIMLWQCGQ